MNSDEQTPLPQGVTHTYRICLGVKLAPARASWFDGLTLSYNAAGHTILSGDLADQAALQGVLAKVYNMGLPLISVQRVEPEPSQDVDKEK